VVGLTGVIDTSPSEALDSAITIGHEDDPAEFVIPVDDPGIRHCRLPEL
jgi:hypothetical protein